MASVHRRPLKPWLFAASACSLAVFSAFHFAKAQSVSRPKGPGTLHFSTKLGSFKLLSIEDELISGHIEMTFSGTILLTGAAKPVLSGSLREEYRYPDLQKVAYSGKGKLVVDGPLKSLQWFGSDLNAVFTGRGKVRLVGEFDKNLDTGEYWFTDPKKKMPWPANNLQELVVPPYSVGAAPETVPIPRGQKPPAGK